MSAAVKTPATTSVRLVWPFLALAERSGRDVRALVAARFGLSVAQLLDPDTRVPQSILAALLDEAIEHSGERDIGLIAARHVDGAHLGIGEYVARTRATLGDAVQDTGRYLPLLGDGAGHAVERRGKRAIVRIWFSPELQIHEAAYEFAMAIGVLRARRITGIADLAPISVHFMHLRPASTERHQKLFRCPVHFGAEITHLVMATRFLETKMAFAEPALAALLERQADELLARLPRGHDVTSRVLTMLGGTTDLRSAGAERAAQQLGMSVRTLARRLDDEGTSYRALFDEVRKQTALRELAHGARSIAEIADRLGFASSQSFHRAFRRWTGTTADRVRRNRSRETKSPPAAGARSAVRRSPPSV
jgi:AraC-like DNA-binding protein